jgi:stage III sporulation protein AA
MNAVLPYLPEPLRGMLDKLPAPDRSAAEEIRIREMRPLEIVVAGKPRFVSPDGKLTLDPSQAYLPKKEDSARLLDLLTNHSVYTFEEELRRGYITIAGGHRVGLAGRALLERGEVRLLRDIGSFNIRIAREIKGAGVPLIPVLWDKAAGNVHQTLVVSPPQHGKTTLVRDLARLISAGGLSGDGRTHAGLKVGIVDERSEIAACVKGVPSFDVGPRTDVLDGCPKAEGMMMMIRSMSPDVLVVDEIGRPEDAAALHEALHAGVRVIATAHGRDAEDACARPVMRALLQERMFSRIVEMSRSEATGIRRCTVRDADGRVLAVRQLAPRREAGVPIC